MRRVFGDPTVTWPKSARNRANLVAMATEDPTLFPLALETLRSALMASGARTAQAMVKTVQEDLRVARQAVYRAEADLFTLAEFLGQVVELDADPFDTTWRPCEWPPYVDPFGEEDGGGE